MCNFCLQSLPDYWYTSFFFLVGPGLLHEIVVSAFSRSPLGRVSTLSFISLLTSRISLNALPLPPIVSTLAFHVFYACLVPSKLLYGQRLFLVSSYLFPYFLDYFTPSYSSSPSCCSLPYSLINYGWQPLSWHVPYFILPFELSHVSIFLSGYIPGSALSAVLHVVFEHPSTFFLLQSFVLFPAVLQVSRFLPILLMHILALAQSPSS